jgi:hypothetical protein
MGLNIRALDIKPAFATGSAWLAISLVDDGHALTLMGASF